MSALLNTPTSKQSKYRPIGKAWLKLHYWELQKTVETIAVERKCTSNWVQSEIRRHGVEKSKNGIKYRGKKNYIMPESEKIKHHKQPHAREIYRISPASLKVTKQYRSLIFAAECNDTTPTRIRRAMKLARKHKKYFWAYHDEIEQILSIHRNSIMIETAALLREGVSAENIAEKLSISKILLRNILREMPQHLKTPPQTKKKKPRISEEEMKKFRKEQEEKRFAKERQKYLGVAS